MTIKTADGNVENVASNGVANTGLGFGIAGTALGLLNGGMGLFGNGTGVNRTNNNMQNSCDPGSSFVTRHELDLIQQLQSKDIQLAQKDSQLALKESESYTDQKMVEVYTALKNSENSLRDEVRANKDAQIAINSQQAAWNAAATGSMSAMSAQIQALQSITMNVVPSSRVCDTGCCGCN